MCIESFREEPKVCASSACVGVLQSQKPGNNFSSFVTKHSHFPQNREPRPLSAKQTLKNVVPLGFLFYYVTNTVILGTSSLFFRGSQKIFLRWDCAFRMRCLKVSHYGVVVFTSPFQAFIGKKAAIFCSCFNGITSLSLTLVIHCVMWLSTHRPGLLAKEPQFKLQLSFCIDLKFSNVFTKLMRCQGQVQYLRYLLSKSISMLHHYGDALSWFARMKRSFCRGTSRHPLLLEPNSSADDTGTYSLKLLHKCHSTTSEQRVWGKGKRLEYLSLFSGGYLSEYESKGYMVGILSAVRYLLDRNILHRDLKPGNILIGSWATKFFVYLATFTFLLNTSLQEQMGM